MKNIALTILATLNLSFLVVAQNTPSPQIEFDKIEHDFGYIKEEGGVVTTTFTFKNISDKPYIIRNVSVSCGCTTPEYDKAPVMPGKSGVIKVTYDPYGRPGAFLKPVYISEASRKYTDKLSITGYVQGRPKSIEDEYPVAYPSGLRISSTSIQYDKIPVGYRHTMIIDLYNSSDNKIELSAAAVKDDRINVAVPSSLEPKAKGQLSVTYDLKSNPAYKKIDGEVELKVNGKSLPKNLAIRGVSTPDFTLFTPEQMTNAATGELSSRFYHFGDIVLGSSVTREFTIQNIGKSDFEIVADVPGSDQIAYTISKKVVPQGESCTIKVTLNPKKAGRESLSIMLITNDPTEPIKEIRIAANVKSE